MSSESTLLYRRAGSTLPKRELREFVNRLRSELAGHRSFTCLLTNDRELQRLNRMFLKRDYAADVLSFPSGTEEQLGELAISVERAAEQANAFGHTITEEIKILMLHGLLHLLGMNHENDRGAMARAELRWREHLGLQVSGLIERSRK
ncbi:MAG: rRNA maturation RNase YbeY [Bryobacteraceae bacterium]